IRGDYFFFGLLYACILQHRHERLVKRPRIERRSDDNPLDETRQLDARQTLLGKILQRYLVNRLRHAVDRLNGSFENLGLLHSRQVNNAPFAFLCEPGMFCASSGKSEHINDSSHLVFARHSSEKIATLANIPNYSKQLFVKVVAAKVSDRATV